MAVPFPPPRLPKTALKSIKLVPGCHFSPVDLLSSKCSCLLPLPLPTRHNPTQEISGKATSAGDFLAIQQGRLAQVWLTLTDGSVPIPKMVEQAGELVHRRLRERGYELTHLVAVTEDKEEGEGVCDDGRGCPIRFDGNLVTVDQKAINGTSSDPASNDTGILAQSEIVASLPVRETSDKHNKSIVKGGDKEKYPRSIFIYWLIPCPNTPIGHRWLAQLVLQIDQYGMTGPPGRVAGAQSRFATDLDDWTAIGDGGTDYFRKGGGLPVKLKYVGDQDGDGNTGLIYDRLISTIRNKLGEGCNFSRSQVLAHVQRATQEIEMGRNGGEGSKVQVLEVETVYRRSKRDSGSTVPVVRIALQTAESSIGKDAETGAVILLHTTKGKETWKVSSVQVAYEGEWPVCHGYRRDTRSAEEAGPEKALEKWLSTRHDSP